MCRMSCSWCSAIMTEPQPRNSSALNTPWETKWSMAAVPLATATAANMIASWLTVDQASEGADRRGRRVAVVRLVEGARELLQHLVLLGPGQALGAAGVEVLGGRCFVTPRIDATVGAAHHEVGRELGQLRCKRHHALRPREAVRVGGCSTTRGAGIQRRELFHRRHAGRGLPRAVAVRDALADRADLRARERQLRRIGDLAAGRSFEGETVNYRLDRTPFLVHWRIEPIVVDGQQTPADCATIVAFQKRFGISPSKGRAGPTTADVAMAVKGGVAQVDRNVVTVLGMILAAMLVGGLIGLAGAVIFASGLRPAQANTAGQKTAKPQAAGKTEAGFRAYGAMRAGMKRMPAGASRAISCARQPAPASWW